MFHFKVQIGDEKKKCLTLSVGETLSQGRKTIKNV